MRIETLSEENTEKRSQNIPSFTNRGFDFLEITSIIKQRVFFSSNNTCFS